jgi:HEAT repeat protein
MKGSKGKKASKLTKEEMSEALHRIQDTEDMDEIIELSRSESALVRQKAAQQMCPCRVGKDFEEFWQRIFELAEDEDSEVRY